MKKLLFILLLFSIKSYSQTATLFKNQNFNGNSILRAKIHPVKRRDSLPILTIKDTNVMATTLDSQKLFLWVGNYWKEIAGSIAYNNTYNFDTTIMRRIDTKIDSVYYDLNNDTLFVKKDSIITRFAQKRYVNSIYVTSGKDSIYYTKNDSTYYLILNKLDSTSWIYSAIKSNDTTLIFKRKSGLNDTIFIQKIDTTSLSNRINKKIDSVYYSIANDTLFVKKDSIITKFAQKRYIDSIYSNASKDSIIYVKNNDTVKVALNQLDTSSWIYSSEKLNDTTLILKRKSGINDTIKISSAKELDTTSLSDRIDKKIDSIYKVSDSVFYKIGDSTYFAFKDSTGMSKNGIFGNDTATTIMAKIHNASGLTLNGGNVVYMSTSSNNSSVPSVRLANNRHDSTSANTFGFVYNSIGPNDTGFIMLSGRLEKINTSSYNNGDIIYLDSINGRFTNKKPKAPFHLVYLGVVVKANGGNGAIYVKCQNGYEIDELHDVQINDSLKNNDILVYSDTQKVWKNRNIKSILDTSSLSKRINKRIDSIYYGASKDTLYYRFDTTTVKLAQKRYVDSIYKNVNQDSLFYRISDSTMKMSLAPSYLVAEYGESLLASNYILNVNAAQTLLTATIPSAGTWEIEYSLNVENTGANANDGASFWVSDANAVEITGSGQTTSLTSAANGGGSISRKVVVNTAGATTYTIRGQRFSDATQVTVLGGASVSAIQGTMTTYRGSSKVSWRKIGGFLPLTPKTITEKITVGATTTAPTKSPNAQVDYCSIVDDNSGWVELSMDYRAVAASGAANGSGQYIYTLPAGYKFDITTHAIYNADASSVTSFALLTQEIPGSHFQVLHSSAHQIFYAIPYSATQFRLAGGNGLQGSGLSVNTFHNSGYFGFSDATAFRVGGRMRFKKGN